MFEGPVFVVENYGGWVVLDNWWPMINGEARGKLRELVALRHDCERFQRALSAVGSCPELKSSAPQQLAQRAKAAADVLEAEIVRLLSGSNTPLWSDPGEDGVLSGGSDPLETTPRI